MGTERLTNPFETKFQMEGYQRCSASTLGGTGETVRKPI